MADICALDPGTTTGFATKTSDEYRSFEVRADLYPHPHETLYDVLSALQPKTIIYEAFHFRQIMKGVVFTGVEYIGVIELYAQLNCLEVIKITPSDGKGFWDDKKLKVMGVYNIGHPHGNDAMRLLFRHRMKNKIWMEEATEKLKSL